MPDAIYTAGLYLRLSKDDERTGESVSIENQRLLLTNYAHEKGWEIREVYIDDGWSGTNFHRPAFRRMLRDAEDKRINLIIVKDLSRLGRNYIEVGRLTEETLPQLGCRFIAMNDSVDSLLGDNDMMVYRNLFNEFHSKDTSKKVRAVKLACMRQGKFLGTYAPLGYKKDPLNKHRLIIDEETAHIVRRMFGMRRAGSGFRSIAAIFNDECVPSPKTIYYGRNGKKSTRAENGLWNESSVKAILRNEAYIGHMVQGKQGTVSYKNHKLVGKPKENWIRVENTHEPLVSLEDWNMVKELDEISFKPRKTSGKAQNMFVGILKCGDCGFNMRAILRKYSRKDGSVHTAMDFICGNYARSGKSACTVHTISEIALIQLVLEEIRGNAKLMEYDEQKVTEEILRSANRVTTAYLATYKRELKACKDRLAKLDDTIATLYEDRVCGIVTESMFSTLLHKYELERAEKSRTAEILSHKVETFENDNVDAHAWGGLLRKYAEPEMLTQKILLELIDSIEVFEAEKVDKRRVCKVNVTYRFTGPITLASAEQIDSDRNVGI
ncbi:MAG: recombinase family protein [Defluviitaleaceae bacterium]|nr:recombinase family protein [Defluviitaleaceae bacterium]